MDLCKSATVPQCDQIHVACTGTVLRVCAKNKRRVLRLAAPPSATYLVDDGKASDANVDTGLDRDRFERTRNR